MDLVALIKELKKAPNSAYYDLKYKFNYHSNKIEGSTFSLDNLLNLMIHDIVDGKHSFDSIVETKNSLQLFDFVVDSLGKKISKTLLLEYNLILKNNTKDEFKNCFRKSSNIIKRLEDLINWYYSLDNITIKEIAGFHLGFETIHPFQDGNGRIGRFLILKQCLENNINPILITENNALEYRKAMSEDEDSLFAFLNSCEQYKIS